MYCAKSLCHVGRSGVGVITSAAGAAIRDILNVLQRRFRGVGVVLIPSSVQGEKAPAELVAALDLAQRVRPAFDVLIVGRGGGSVEDLWAFNEEIVVRAIAGCSIPVVSAVGHEIDFTLSDGVADLRAPTPSVAAELVVQNVEDIEKVLKQLRHRVVQAMKNALAVRRKALLKMPSPRQWIQNAQMRADQSQQNLISQVKKDLEKKKEHWQQKEALLYSLSPHRILQRGYAVVRTTHGRVVVGVQQIAVGEVVDILFAQGQAQAEVTKIGNKSFVSDCPQTEIKS